MLTTTSLMCLMLLFLHCMVNVGAFWHPASMFILQSRSNSLSMSSTSTDYDIKTLKTMLTELAGPTKNGLLASPSTTIEIASVISSLNLLNKITDLTTSAILDGEWTLLYTTNSGSSAGKIGPFIGTVTQDIDLASTFYENKVTIFPFVEASLDATWEHDAFSFDTLWLVKFKKLVLRVFGVPVVTKELDQTGFWRMTYLDADLRILYAKGGKNLKKENVYVLVK